MEIVRSVPLCCVIAKRTVRIKMRKLLGDLIIASGCRMALFTAGHRIDLIELPFAYTALKDHDVAVVDVRNYEVIGIAPEANLIIVKL